MYKLFEITGWLLKDGYYLYIPEDVSECKCLKSVYGCLQEYVPYACSRCGSLNRKPR